MDRRRLATVVCFAAGGLFLVGCSGSPRGPKVSGQVLLDGKELSDAQVVFEGKGGGVTRTNSEGKFQFDGATPATTVQPGKYLVLITKFVDKKGNLPDAEEYEQLVAANLVKNLVPAKYSDLEVAPLTADVHEGVTELKPFDLKSK